MGVLLVASFVIKPKSSRHKTEHHEKSQDRKHIKESKT